MIQNELLKKRVYALTVDFFIVVVTNYFFMASFTNFVKTIFFHLSLRSQMFLITKLSMLSSVSLISLTFAYFSLFYFVTNGRTMGKTLFGLKVETKDQSEMTLVQAMQRSFAYFTCSMLGSFLFALSFVRKDNKSLADLFSGTTVAFDQKEVATEAAPQGTEFQLTLLKTIEEPQMVEASVVEEEVEYFEQNKAA